MESLKSYLRKFPNYHPHLFQDVLPFLSTKNIKAGDYFLEEGKISRNIAFIESGLFRLFYLNDGKEVTTCFCRENSITCSYKSLITNTPSDISIQAIEDSDIIMFSYASLQTLYEQEPFWQQVGRLALENEFLTTDCHTRSINDLSATERYQNILENESELLQRVPLNHLASYIQVAPETLSRIRKKIAQT